MTVGTALMVLRIHETHHRAVNSFAMSGDLLPDGAPARHNSQGRLERIDFLVMGAVQ